MMLNDDFFSEFPPVSKDEWLRQIAKDLKGRPLEELDWQIGDDLKVSPFVHAEDFAASPLPFSDEANNWEICEDVFVNERVAANRQALEALEGGAGGLRFIFEKMPDAAVFEQVFEKIHLDFIGLHFAGPGVAENPGAILGNLERLAKQKGISTQNLRGSLGYDPAVKAGIIDWRYLVDLAVFAKEKFPQFRLVTVAIPPSASGLTTGLKRGNLYLEKLTERGLSPAEAANTLQFSVSVGKSYFLEISKLRAFKLLWLNVLKAWGAPLNYPVVEANFQPEAYSDELYTNMIRATTMAMSAILGGADRLTVLPYDAGRESQATYSQSFSRRIARNVQHLLKMESFLNEIPDAAAGSYYIEKLTEQLAEKSWEEFQTQNF
jgi:methylmalonyl-CoA mutase